MLKMPFPKVLYLDHTVRRNRLMKKDVRRRKGGAACNVAKKRRHTGLANAKFLPVGQGCSESEGGAETENLSID